MKVNNRRSFRSSIIKVSDVKSLIEIIENLVDTENKDKDYKTNPKFEIVKKDNFEYEYNISNDFLQELANNAEDIESFTIYFRGDTEMINVRCGGYDPQFHIEGNDKSRVMNYSEIISKIFKVKTWNDFIQGPWMQSIISVLLFTFIVLIVILFYRAKTSVLLLGAILIYSICFVIAIPIEKYLKHMYPKLIIKTNNEISARSFKNDIGKIIGIIIFTYIIPYIISKL